MTKLISLDGNKLEAEPKEELPVESEFEIILNDEGQTRLTGTGVLVITPGFVGIGNNKQTEIRAVVPFGLIKFVQRIGPAAQSVSDQPKGSA